MAEFILARLLPEPKLRYHNDSGQKKTQGTQSTQGEMRKKYLKKFLRRINIRQWLAKFVIFD